MKVDQLVDAALDEDDRSRSAGERPRGGRWRKWAVGVALAMWACGFFVAKVPGATRPEMAGASAFFVVAFALPSYAVLWKWLGARSSLQVLAALSAFALGIETLAVATGWPYGRFSYGDAIGAKVAGMVPWTVPFAWAPLVLGTYALVQRLLPEAEASDRRANLTSAWPQVLVGALALGAADLVLDPGAVLQKFWAYENPGLYYGVPASNYFGWLLSGVVGHVLMRLLLSPEISKEGANNIGARRQALAPAGLAASLVWTLAFWSSVCLWASLWMPALVGHAYLAALWMLLRPATGKRA